MNQGYKNRYVAGYIMIQLNHATWDEFFILSSMIN